MKRSSLALGAWLALASAPVHADFFAEVASTHAVDLDGTKDGAVAFVDLNHDNLPDLIVNRDGSSVIFRNTGASAPLTAFANSTEDWASGLTTRNRERSIVFGDLNHDGLVDFAVNTTNAIDIWLNNGPAGSDAITFGRTSGQNGTCPCKPSQTLGNGTILGANTLNSEGMALIDFNNDGFLDLIVDNHDDGVYSFRNDGVGQFVWDGAPQPTLLPLSGASDGDYAAALDFTLDGYVDFAARKKLSGTSGGHDLYVNQANGTFSSASMPNIQADNTHKGGTVFCDFDDDGDYDMFWGHGVIAGSTHAPNQILENNEGTFVGRGTLPGMTVSNASNLTPTQGVDCLDYDNDGDLDLYVAHANGTDFLYRNDGNFTMVQVVSAFGMGDTEGITVADFDADGDVDLYLNRDNARNQLFLNDANDSGSNNYLFVRVLADVSAACVADADRTTRADIGANVRLLDSSFQPITGMRDVNAARGHGGQRFPDVHFGLRAGADERYIVELRYNHMTLGRKIVAHRVVQPNTLGAYQRVVIVDSDVDEDGIRTSDELADSIGIATDLDGDGLDAWSDDDSDGDGIPDAIEATSNSGATGPCFARANTDLTGAPDYLDLDSDDDSLLDSAEGTSDDDGDGVPNYRDPDSDNDGVCDGNQAIVGVCVAGPDTAPYDASRCRDLDNDGCDDCTRVMTGGGETANDGIDSDGDGACNATDPDDDNDGVCDGAADIVSICVGGPDVAPTDPRQCQDVDNDNCDDCTRVPTDGGDPSDDGPDSDADGNCDTNDADDDNDGVCDGNVNVAGVCTAGPDIAPTDPTRCQDVDNDTCDDCTIVMTGGGDPSRDGPDTNADGICDNAPVADFDDDQIADEFDLDDDNDGIPDTTEGAGDTDGDGAPDSTDLDSDNDGILDVVEAGHGAADIDRDGMVDCIVGFDPADNGICDELETAADSGIVDYNSDGSGPDMPSNTDGRGPPDFQDLDSDDDGVPDLAEGGSDCADTIRDAVCDGPDTDSDGVADSIDEFIGVGDAGYSDPANSDNAGARDYQALDADDDGISDYQEGGSGCSNTAPQDDRCDGGDADNDGIVDSIDTTDNFGAPGWQAPASFDNDSLPDYRDVDADNDGLLDVLEGAADTDSDGHLDYRDLDSDNDGIWDLVEALSGCRDETVKNGQCDGPFTIGGLATDASGELPPDTDNDAIADFRDLDSDNDGASDVLEGASGCADTAPLDAVCDGPVDAHGVATSATVNIRDSDGDAVADYRDLDADNDGIADVREVGSNCEDSNDNAVCDLPDSDGDGIVDALDNSLGFGDSSPTQPRDDDGQDGPDFLDLDSDNDGTPDVTASTCTIAGMRCSGPDSDGDGGVDDIDSYHGFGFRGDTDGDGVNDSVDIDDDNDGILDVDEQTTVIDADTDTTPNARDLDSDNDGIADLTEAGHGGADANGDGILDCAGGFGPNGLCDALETSPESGQIAAGGPRDTDLDGIADFLDLDSDDDSVSDLLEGRTPCADARPRNGVCDGPDRDRDGVSDTIDTTTGFGAAAGLVTTPPDRDNDGIPDVLDLDSDSDGIFDIVEVGRAIADLDSDGTADASDSDNDGLRDSVDDSDNDGTIDAEDPNERAFGGALSEPDTDGDAVPDRLDEDSDNDTIPDAQEAGPPGETYPLDTDNDGTPDFQDSDSDNDGIPDVADNCRVTSNENQVDSDNNNVGDHCQVDDVKDDNGVQVGQSGCSVNNTAPWLLLAVLVLLYIRRRISPSPPTI